MWNDPLEVLPEEEELVLVTTIHGTAHMMYFMGEYFYTDMEYVEGYDCSASELHYYAVLGWKKAEGMVADISPLLYKRIEDRARRLLEVTSLTRLSLENTLCVTQGMSQRVLTTLVKEGYAERKKESGVYVYRKKHSGVV